MRAFNKIIFLTSLSILIFCTVLMAKEHKKTESYKVLIGAKPEYIMKYAGADTLVIDAEYFSKEDIAALHKKNKKIYSYLNIGSIESFRKDYKSFLDLNLGAYENWDEELWIDVSNKAWQKRIENLADKYYKKGVDGLFLDNADVYYFHKSERIYKGLLKILRSLAEFKKPLIINGGDAFIARAIEENKLKNLIYGINQESVFTEIDFQKKSYGIKSKSESEYFKAYIKKCREYGLKIYLLEYGADEELSEKIARYCKKNDFEYYIAEGLNLDR